MELQNALRRGLQKMESFDLQKFLPAWNASLNGLAFVCLCLGLFFIKKKNIPAHQKTMTTAFLVSAIFLASYLYYHFNFPSTRFQGQGLIRPLYFIMLVSHIILAVVVLPFILRLFYLIKKDQPQKHAKLARIVWPIWAYVSLTGVLIYLCLYQLYPAVN